MTSDQDARRVSRNLGEDLERLLTERGVHLTRAAIALTGSRQEGEDLLQAALERVLRHPRKVESDLEGYLRRTLYNLAADNWRRHGTWLRKLPLVRLQHSGATAGDATAGVDLRDALVRMLQQLPRRQRAVIVLRYWEHRQILAAFTVAGRGQLEGKPAIKLVTARSVATLPVLEVLWVSATTYLPMRMILIPRPGIPAATRSQLDFRWLPATNVNLARASILPAPAGFSRQPWQG